MNPFSKPGKLFLALGLTFGLAFAVLTPPFQAPDEPEHFLRAWQISGGEMLPGEFSEKGEPGGHFSSNFLYAIHRGLGDIPGHPENKADLNRIIELMGMIIKSRHNPFTTLHTHADLFPLFYAPQATGMFLGRVSEFPPVALVYMGRLANLAVWLALVFAAITITPVFRPLFVVAGLLPMNLFLAGTLSPDALMIALSMVFMACVFKLAFKEPDKALYYKLALLALAPALALAHPAALALPLAALGISDKNTVDRAGRLAVAGLAVALGAGAWYAWHLASQHAAGAAPVLGVGLAQNLGYKAATLANHPLDTVLLWLKELTLHIEELANQMAGSKLGWLDTRIPSMAVALSWLALILTGVAGLEGKSMRGNTRFALALTVAAGLVSLAGLSWLRFTPPGMNTVGGMQGRFILPLAVPAMALLASRAGARLAPAARLVWPLAAVMAPATALVFLVLRYWIQFPAK